ncbi:aquaporin-9-like isoform X2 [Dreissena polymorpha]|nr:aquaporin-9-like isoform X2 [Dreissena polymorpha]
MRGLTIQSLGKIKTRWVTEALSEILSTFILALFVYASGAQFLLSEGWASSATGKACAAAVGLTIAVYAGMGAAGGSANPNVSIMFCLLGKFKWRKLPVYIIAEFIGAFLAALVTFYAYGDLINKFDGGVHTISGQYATAPLFTSFPHASISHTTGFFDVVIGTALLTGSIAAITDPNNAGVNKNMIPLIFAPMLFGILMTFGLQTGAAINTALDLSGRVFVAVFYGPQVFTANDNWAWIPPLGGFGGSLVGTFLYQLMVGNHLESPKYETQDQELNVKDDGKTVDLRAYKTANNSSMSSHDFISTLDGNQY